MDPADFRRRLDAATADAPPGPRADEDLIGGKTLLRRRRTTITGAGLAAAVLLGVPLAVMGTREAADEPSPTGPSMSSAVPGEPREGWRWESYRDATFQVPEAWTYASPTAWCLHPEPAVRRPTDHARRISCGPTGGLGVTFANESTYDSRTPAGYLVEIGGAWMGHEVGGDTVVAVRARTEQQARDVLASVQPIEDDDAYGCAATARFDTTTPSSGAEPALPSIGSVGSISVCRYAVRGGSAAGELVQSERLTGEDASEALAAISAAPVLRPVEMSCPEARDTEAVMLRLDGHEVWVNWANDCRAIGVTDGDQVRALTADVLHWALSPGWSGEFPVEHVADHDLFVQRSLEDGQ